MFTRFWLCLMLPGLVCLPFVLWRMNLAINHPEKYERLKEWENQETNRQKKIVKNIASVGFGIAKRWKR